MYMSRCCCCCLFLCCVFVYCERTQNGSKTTKKKTTTRDKQKLDQKSKRRIIIHDEQNKYADSFRNTQQSSVKMKLARIKAKCDDGRLCRNFVCSEGQSVLFVVVFFWSKLNSFIARNAKI